MWGFREFVIFRGFGGLVEVSSWFHGFTGLLRKEVTAFCEVVTYGLGFRAL